METISTQTQRKPHCHVPRYTKQIDESDLAHTYSAFLLVQGMGCPNCAMRVHNSLLKLDGVLSVEVDLERALVHVLFNPSRAVVPSLANAVAAAGNDGRHHYTAQLLGVYEQSLE